MFVYNYMEEQANSLFDFILEFFDRDSDSSEVSWYFFMTRRIPKEQQTEVYKILTRIAKIKYGPIKRRPRYNGEVYLKATRAVKKILKWIQRDWMKIRHKQLNVQSRYIQEQTVKVLNSSLPLSKEYAILFNMILDWKPFVSLTKKQVL
jgi:hypothetical protein